MSTRQVVEEHRRRAARVRKTIDAEVRKWWRRLNRDQLDRSWEALVGKQILTAVTYGQQPLASDADGYLDQFIGELGVDRDRAGEVNPVAFAGIASDGRPMDTLLRQPVIRTKTLIRRGASPTRAMNAGELSLRQIVKTQLTDAGRVADGVASVADTAIVGYERHVHLPSCSRCIVLAGRLYRWSEGFQRHPLCDCVHEPVTSQQHREENLDQVPSRLFRQMSPEQQDKVFTKAGAQAIRDGADVSQVVNARRGMRPASIGGQDVVITSEGTTKRGLSTDIRRTIDRLEGRETRYISRNLGQRGFVTNYTERRTRTPRIMPETIYRVAESRDEAIRLLARNGFITDAPGENGVNAIQRAARAAADI